MTVQMVALTLCSRPASAVMPPTVNCANGGTQARASTIMPPTVNCANGGTQAMQQTRLSHHTTDSELCIWWHLGYAADTRHMGLNHLTSLLCYVSLRFCMILPQSSVSAVLSLCPFSVRSALL